MPTKFIAPPKTLRLGGGATLALRLRLPCSAVKGTSSEFARTEIAEAMKSTDTNNRSRVIKLRVTQEEYALAQRVSVSQGFGERGLSACTRALFRQAAKGNLNLRLPTKLVGSSQEPVVPLADEKFMMQLRAIGRNINQIAKELHRFERQGASVDELTKLGKGIAHIITAMSLGPDAARHYVRASLSRLADFPPDSDQNQSHIRETKS